MSMSNALSRRRRDRHARPGLEALEGRALLSGAATRVVPFKGTVTATFTFEPTNTPGEFVVNYKDTETGTKFGTLMSSAQYKVNASYLSDYTRQRETVSGVDFTLTATDGSTLSGTYTVTTTPTRNAGRIFYVAHEVITQGTGDFLGATGRITSIGTVDLTTNQVHAKDTGIVRLPQRT